MSKVTISHLWKKKAWTTLGIDHENFHKFLLFIITNSEWYAPAKTRKYETIKKCYSINIQKNWTINHQTRNYKR
jgi:hypothetical protein